jgi:hypothetical protein
MNAYRPVVARHVGTADAGVQWYTRP